jgi:hypothetical protein
MGAFVLSFVRLFVCSRTLLQSDRHLKRPMLIQMVAHLRQRDSKQPREQHPLQEAAETVHRHSAPAEHASLAAVREEVNHLRVLPAEHRLDRATHDIEEDLRKTPFGLTFSYACPEPVLVIMIVLSTKWLKKGVFPAPAR